MYNHIGIVPEFHPATFYTQQLNGNLNYPIFQSGRGMGSCLFNIIKSVGTPLLKEIILTTVKEEAGQVIKDVTSGVGVKNALMQEWCHMCWKINFEERNTVSHERQRSYT